MKKEYEIVEHPSGYWIELADSIGRMGTISGPYSTIEEAEKDIPDGQLQYPLPLNLKKDNEERKEHEWEIVDGQIRRMNND